MLGYLIRIFRLFIQFSSSIVITPNPPRGTGKLAVLRYLAGTSDAAPKTPQSFIILDRVSWISQPGFSVAGPDPPPLVGQDIRALPRRNGLMAVPTVVDHLDIRLRK